MRGKRGRSTGRGALVRRRHIYILTPPLLEARSDGSI